MLYLNNQNSQIDRLNFGNPVSEAAHEFASTTSETLVGGLGTPARCLMPPKIPSWDGGRLAFEMKVDPRKTNYMTVRFWGSDVNDNKLLLFCEGKQIGYHFIGDVDAIDFGTEGNEGGFLKRFYYVTTPLPEAMTAGKTQLHFEIRALGPIFPYGQTFALYQKPQIVPSRGIYAAYTSIDGCFRPPPDEAQGAAFLNPPTRKAPGPEILDALKNRLNRTFDQMLAKKKPLNQMEVHTLARGYKIAWTHAYENPKALERIIEGGDDLYRRYKADPKLVTFEKDTYNPDWFGFGPFGQVVDWMSPILDLDEPISDGQGKTIPRRFAYAEMLQASRDFLRTHRRWYTNQSMIVDLYAYLSNRGLRAVDPSLAYPEKKMLDYLYQSLGLRPWLGSDLLYGGSERKLGDSYYQITKKGLTRELGYVGYYGEVLDWATLIYQATKGRGEEGDAAVKAQVIKIARARAPFRYPEVDGEGNRAMRVESIIGWRDAHYPSDIVYGERFAWDGSPLFLANQIGDPYSVGYAQQMFGDNQFYALTELAMQRNGLRVDAGLLNVPDEVAALLKAKPSRERLPMSEKRDFAFSDEQDGVVAIRNGRDTLYASLYWRARSGINFLGRVHFIRPNLDRIATVREDIQYTPSGHFYTRPDNVDTLAQGSPFRDYGDVHTALAGEKLPIPVVPKGTSYVPGDESVFAGRGSLYTLKYGSYEIVMNMSEDKTFTVQTPQSGRTVKELISQKIVPPSEKTHTLKPLSTVIYFTGDRDR